MRGISGSVAIRKQSLVMKASNEKVLRNYLKLYQAIRERMGSVCYAISAKRIGLSY